MKRARDTDELKEAVKADLGLRMLYIKYVQRTRMADEKRRRDVASGAIVEPEGEVDERPQGSRRPAGDAVPSKR